ncbi:hypothetical protein ABZ502_17780 [Streptomyces abikoensis]
MTTNYYAYGPFRSGDVRETASTSASLLPDGVSCSRATVTEA